MNINKIKKLMKLLILVSLTSVYSIGSSHAQDDYPNQAIRVIIPFSPGGSADPAGRLVSAKLQEVLGQPVVVENRAGAGGAVGAQEVARAEPDGYTLLVGTASTHTTNPLTTDTPYDAVEDFEPIGAYGVGTMVIVVNKDVPANNLEELIALLKESPGEYSYGSAGVGSINHFAGELFNSEAGTEMLHIPYQGTGNSVVDVIGGQIPVLMAILTSSIVQQHEAGALRILAIASEERSSLVPDVPTGAEHGLPGWRISTFGMLFAPKGTPEPVLETLNSALDTVLKDPAFREDMETSLFFDVPEGALSIEENRAMIRDDLERLRPVAEAAGILFN